MTNVMDLWHWPMSALEVDTVYRSSAMPISQARQDKLTRTAINPQRPTDVLVTAERLDLLHDQLKNTRGRTPDRSVNNISCSAIGTKVANGKQILNMLLEAGIQETLRQEKVKKPPATPTPTAAVAATTAPSGDSHPEEKEKDHKGKDDTKAKDKKGKKK